MWDTSHTTAPRATAVSHAGSATAVGSPLASSSSSSFVPREKVFGEPVGVGGRVTGANNPLARPAEVRSSRVVVVVVVVGSIGRGAVDGL